MLLLLFPAARAAGDVLVLPDGRRLQCVLMSDDGDRYAFRTKYGKSSLPKFAVVDVERASTKENMQLLAEWGKPAAGTTPKAEAPAPQPRARKKRSSGRILKVTDRNFDRIVLRSKQPVLVDFYATWCGPCKTQAPILHKLAREYRGKVRFAKLDVDRSPQMSKRYNARTIPMLVVFKDGKAVKVLHGVHRAPQLRRILNTVGS